MELKHLNEQEFNTVKNGTKPAMIDFFATWCGPCKMLGPVMEQRSGASWAYSPQRPMRKRWTSCCKGHSDSKKAGRR